ncbi:MAG: iron ABC transporter permease [Actinomycetota bacterium]|nr:iron ABC transporter permease [Actinomycetota bacterium]
MIVEFFTPTVDVWRHLWATRLPEMIVNTLVLVVGVGIGTVVLGTGLAWLVVAHRFPGRALFDWLLILPLAMPTYVLAFVFLSMFDFAGPVQTAARGWLGPDVWFPEIRSGGAVILVMTLVLYPYVYLLARTAFQEQSAVTFEAARSLGSSRRSAFYRVVLPLARPSIAAGLTLVLMEVLTDIGAVRFLNFPTITDGVFRVWLGMGERDAAVELAGLLLLFVLVIIVLERRMRGRARYYQAGGRDRGVTPVQLTGRAAWLATGACTVVIGAAFVLPVSRLVVWVVAEAARGAPGFFDSLYWGFARNSLVLSGAATLLAIFVALVLANGVRSSRGRAVKVGARLATMGYAMPGAVVAFGVLVLLSSADNVLNYLSQAFWGIDVGLILTGSAVGLIYAYVVRFMAVGYYSVEASLEKVTPSMDDAARSLGASSGRVLRRIHLPLVRVGMFTGAALLFVDMMKELPITLLLRPFGYDTLSVWVWQMASESLWSGAALPALTIVVTGLIPVMLLRHAATSRHWTGRFAGGSRRRTTEPAEAQQ